MRRFTNEAKFKNDIKRGLSSLFYESQDSLLHPSMKFKESRIQAKCLVIKNLYNIQKGNFSVISRILVDF